MARTRHPNMQARLIANSVLSEEYFFEGTPCWDWIGSFGTGGTSTKRYPQLAVRVNGKVKTLRAHRVSYEEFTGNKLGEMEAGHKCNRTCCIAPLHLGPVTKSQNAVYREHTKRAVSK